ncbi:unnamed protein product [marine sediment metagenome]|uniref:Uncharacterized protein n=1 Tax=marine sediment metagenome TaxID=412755 RepID=X0Z2Q7_9ZZZZ
MGIYSWRDEEMEELSGIIDKAILGAIMGLLDENSDTILKILEVMEKRKEK